MSAEKNKILAKRWFDAWNEGNNSEANNLFAADVVIHISLPPPGDS